MSDNPKDPPLEMLESAGCYVATVVDLAAVRIRIGRTPYKMKACKHEKLIYCQTERRVWCEECERTVDNFDAFSTLARNFERMVADVRHKNAKATDAMAATLIRRAAKELDKVWMGKMIPCCPHCRKGLFPQDFENGAASSMGIEYALALRNKDNKK